MLITLFYYIIISFFYYLSCLKLSKDNKYISITLFFILAIGFKLLIPLDNRLPDYEVYYELLGSNNEKLSIDYLISEPYFYSMTNMLQLFFNKTSSLQIFYYINFFLSLIFFTWLALKTNIITWKKYLLYILYFPLFSFILLRNAPAYISLALLFFYLNEKKYFKISFLAFLSHISSIPAIFSSFFNNKKIGFLLIPILLFFIFLFFYLIQSQDFILFNKFESYQNIDEFGQNIFHKLYFISMILLFLSLILKYYNSFYNYTFIILYLVYFLLQYISPIMGFRFSIYIIIYILLNKHFKFSRNIDRYLNLYSFLFIPIGILSMYFYQLL